MNSFWTLAYDQRLVYDQRDAVQLSLRPITLCWIRYVDLKYDPLKGRRALNSHLFNIAFS